jgi:hypothetical protein
MGEMYLKIRFKNARLFLNKDNRLCKHITYDDVDKMSTSRALEKNFKEYITVYQISNLIHILFGQRPVPSFRKVYGYGIVDRLFEKAKMSYLKLEYAKLTNKKGEEYPYQECTTLNKASSNANLTMGVASWEHVYRRIHRNKADFQKIKDTFGTVLNMKVTEDKPYMYYVNLLRKVSDVKDKLADIKLTAIKNHIISDANIWQILSVGSKGGIPTLITKGIGSCVNINGEVLIPITDEDYAEIRSSYKGSCTILDGGVVFLEGIEYSDDFNEDYLNDFKKVGDLSIDKI